MLVMAGLDPAIHHAFEMIFERRWIRGSSPRMTSRGLMQTSSQILADLWALAGGEPSALNPVTLTGTEPVLPSSFRVDAE
jgi:hypothetical protein